MDENKTPEQGVTLTAEPAKGTKAKAKDKGEKSFSSGIVQWIKEIRAEFYKIIWPSKKELGKMTLTVIITSLFFGLIIAAMDTVFRTAVTFLIELM